MDEDRAFEILDLPTDASATEIETRFQELANQHHPDSGGNTEELIHLIEARGTAIDSLPSNKLAVYDEKGHLEISNKDKKEKQSEKAVNRIIRKQTSKYRRYKQFLRILAPFLGLFTLLRIFVTITDLGTMSTSEIPLFILVIPLSIWILLLSAVGIAYWGLNTKIKNIEIIVSETEEVFSQKSNLLRVFSDLGIDMERELITEEELQSAFQEWISKDENYTFTQHQADMFRRMLSLLSPRLELRSIARKIGPADFNRIFLRKCVEAEIIEERVESRGKGEFGVNYYINL